MQINERIISNFIHNYMIKDYKDKSFKIYIIENNQIEDNIKNTILNNEIYITSHIFYTDEITLSIIDKSLIVKNHNEDILMSEYILNELLLYCNTYTQTKQDLNNVKGLTNILKHYIQEPINNVNKGFIIKRLGILIHNYNELDTNHHTKDKLKYLIKDILNKELNIINIINNQKYIQYTQI